MTRHWNPIKRVWYNAGGRTKVYATPAARAAAWRKRHTPTDASRAANATRQKRHRVKIGQDPASKPGRPSKTALAAAETQVLDEIFGAGSVEP